MTLGVQFWLVTQGVGTKPLSGMKGFGMNPQLGVEAGLQVQDDGWVSGLEIQRWALGDMFPTTCLPLRKSGNGAATGTAIFKTP